MHKFELFSFSSSPHWEVALEEYQIEATWRLRDWGTLRRELGTLETATLRQNLNASLNQVSFPQFSPQILSLGSNNGNGNSLKEVPEKWTLTILRLLSLIQAQELAPATALIAVRRRKQNKCNQNYNFINPKIRVLAKSLKI